VQFDLFLSGVETNMANLKLGIPFIKGGKPQMASFQFNDRATHNVVPWAGAAAPSHKSKLCQVPAG
jgi:hypothetical protein